MLKFILCLVFLVSNTGFADVKIEQTSSNPKNPKSETKSTVYFKDDMFRMDSGNGSNKTVLLYRKGTALVCTPSKENPKKGSCRDMKKLTGTLSSVAQAKIISLNVSKLPKTASVIGRSCQYFKKTMVMEANAMGVANAKTSMNDELCVDSTIKVSGDVLTQSVLSSLGGMLSAEDTKKMTQAVNQMKGYPLLMTSTSKSAVSKEMKQMLSGIAQMTGKANAQPQVSDKPVTTITKVTSVVDAPLAATLFETPRGFKVE